MPRLLPIVLVCAAILVTQGSYADAPAKDAGPTNPPTATFPVGTWRVEFTNGVNEECRIGNGGESSVEEPRRRSNGMAEVKGGSVVITFHDDRVERWTPVGQRFVVEHWFPASRLPTATPVLGIAERAQWKDIEGLRQELEHRGAKPGPLQIQEHDGKKYYVFFVRECDSQESHDGSCFCFGQPA